MFKYRHAFIYKTLIVLFAILFVLPSTVSATSNDYVQPRASDYLSGYSAYVYVTDSGEVQVWYDVMGTGWMDEIGALSIRIYESVNGVDWTWIETFHYEDCDTMLFYDDYYASSFVSCQGSVYKQYKALVCVWAGKNGDGDSRYFWAYQP